MPRERPGKPPTSTTGRVPANKGQRYPAEPLSADEMQGLIKGCSHKAPTGIRNRALLVLLYRAGLRISEALALKPKDLDLATGAVRVLHGKGDKARVVGLDPGALAVIARWVDRRALLGVGNRAPLLCTLKGATVKDAYVRKLMKRLGHRAGIEKRVHPHGLRHTHAAELAREGTPMNVIQAQLGHSSLATTDRYLRHVAPAELVKLMQARQWTEPA